MKPLWVVEFQKFPTQAARDAKRWEWTPLPAVLSVGGSDEWECGVAVFDSRAEAMRSRAYVRAQYVGHGGRRVARYATEGASRRRTGR